MEPAQGTRSIDRAAVARASLARRFRGRSHAHKVPLGCHGRAARGVARLPLRPHSRHKRGADHPSARAVSRKCAEPSAKRPCLGDRHHPQRGRRRRRPRPARPHRPTTQGRLGPAPGPCKPGGDAPALVAEPRGGSASAADWRARPAPGIRPAPGGCPPSKGHRRRRAWHRQSNHRSGATVGLPLTSAQALRVGVALGDVRAECLPRRCLASPQRARGRSIGSPFAHRSCAARAPLSRGARASVGCSWDAARARLEASPARR